MNLSGGCENVYKNEFAGSACNDLVAVSLQVVHVTTLSLQIKDGSCVLQRLLVSTDNDQLTCRSTLNT